MTAATPEARTKARKQWAERRTANPNRLCPPHHKHEQTTTCVVSHGCLCEPCRNGRKQRRRQADWNTRLLKGQDVWVPATGARRRLEALAWAGWSAPAIAPRIGSHYRPLLKIREGLRESVHLSTHRRIDKVFRELATVEAPGHSGRITRGYARKHGYVPAAAWDDIDRDTAPDFGEPDGRGVDEVAVELAVAGRPVELSREEVRVAVERLHGRRMSDPVIAARVGVSYQTVYRIRQLLGLPAWERGEQFEDARKIA